MGRSKPGPLGFGIFLILCLPSSGQAQSTVSDPQAILLAKQATVALAGTTTVADATMTGTTRWIAGSTDESGPATLKAKGNLLSRVDLVLPSGGRSEARSSSQALPTGAWMLSDLAVHQSVQQNCWTDAGWFFPALSSLAQPSSPNVIFSYVGLETLGATSVQHIRSFHTFPVKDTGTATEIQRLSAMDFYLDSATSLPVWIRFNLHPDNNQHADIAVAVNLSDYRLVSGVQVPFRVQKFVNGSLVLDFSASSVAINSALADSTFVLP